MRESGETRVVAVRNLLWNCETQRRPRMGSFAQAVRLSSNPQTFTFLSLSLILILISWKNGKTEKPKIGVRCQALRVKRAVSSAGSSNRRAVSS
jgi:hypothetical protein